MIVERINAASHLSQRLPGSSLHAVRPLGIPCDAANFPTKHPSPKLPRSHKKTYLHICVHIYMYIYIHIDRFFSSRSLLSQSLTNPTVSNYGEGVRLVV